MDSSLDFDRLVCFGDSLTDTGNIFDLSSQNIEDTQFIESAAELSTLAIDARIAEADLWGLI